MQRFKNILVVLTPQSDSKSQHVFSRARELAVANQAKVTLVYVVDNPQASMKHFDGIISAQEFTEIVREKRHRELGQLATPLQQEGVSVNTEVLVGTGFIEIIKRVLVEDFDLVMKEAQVDDGKLSSEDLHLMRKCPCPVWMLRDNGVSNNVLAAIDLKMEETEQGRQLNRFIMELTTSLAKRQKVNACVVSCWTLYGEDALKNSGFLKVSEKKLMTMLAQEREAHEEKLNTLADEHGVQAKHLNLLKGDAKKVLPQFINEEGFSTVVMGTVGRTGIPGLFIGNTAETVLTSINTSVIAVKPQGFESPVR